MPIELNERYIKNKITEKEYRSLMESLNHIMIYFLEIPNGIDISWDYSNFYYYIRHIGLTHCIPSAFTKIIASREHTGEATCYGINKRKVNMFDLPQAYFELKSFLTNNKYYYVMLEPEEIATEELTN